MDLRTTSISESMHASMKSGFDGVRAGMGTALSANTAVDKSKRRLKERQQQNAREQERNVKWSEMPTAQHLTEYCLLKAKEEWDVSTNLIVVHAKIDPGEWWVFKPHNPSGGVLAPPVYTRLRRVKLVNEKFLWCSCGLPSRLKYPCRHIYAVTKQVSMTMFAVRWHSQFQHYYGRDGAEDWTDVFDVMLAEEFERDHSNGECIFVHGMDFLSQQPESWLSIEDDNNGMVIQAKQLYQLTWIQKRVVVKGLPLPELHVADGAQESTFMDDCEVECHIPDTIQNLQLSQHNAVTSLREKQNAGKAQVREMVRTALNLADQGTAYTEILLDHLQEAIHKISHAIASGNRNQKRGSDFAFPETGRSKQRVEKRKKSTGEF
ncbi:SWIM zinc finger domain protein [Nitzschia inconspicua]|uniref:SWIM zinc finger domain protein n=1 Tax=Nitzschia inconspicua TaxID=303405 RepID=A0A9K3PAD1_9STRA|nr:SWIM zinc finger domain protein [Nitzschia inconspicua]